MLLALVDERDDLCHRGARDLKRLRAGPFASTAPVLVEAYFLLPQGHLRGRLRFLLERIGIDLIDLPSPC